MVRVVNNVLKALVAFYFQVEARRPALKHVVYM